MNNIVTEYHQTIASLQKAKPRSHLRLKLQSKATELLTKILRKEVRRERKQA
jgi:hypothetical protein